MPITKPRPTPDIALVLHPEQDPDYVHFENAFAHPFEAHATSLGRKNAWWLADAALLTYWDPEQAIPRFQGAGLRAEFIEADGLQGYLAVADQFVIVAFRGTEPDDWQDLFDNAQFVLAPWDRPGTNVHAGFKDALEDVWDDLQVRLDALSTSRRVWFAGHSLGGALATLAADRFPATAGLSTIGSPRVGDSAFAQSFDARFGPRTLRYVREADIVTHVPPPFPFPYSHVGERRHIDSEGDVSPQPPGLEHFFTALIGTAEHVAEVIQGLNSGTLQTAPDFLLDHMPRGYTVDVWNDFARNGD
jgi:triacylglycerol lipase